MKAAISPSKEQMVKLGMPEFTVEDFYDNFMENLNSLAGEKAITLDEVEENVLVDLNRVVDFTQLALIFVFGRDRGDSQMTINCLVEKVLWISF